MNVANDIDGNKKSILQLGLACILFEEYTKNVVMRCWYKKIDFAIKSSCLKNIHRILL